MMQMGRIPSVGSSFEWSGLRLEVMDMDKNRVDRVLVSMPRRLHRLIGNLRNITLLLLNVTAETGHTGIFGDGWRLKRFEHKGNYFKP